MRFIALAVALVASINSSPALADSIASHFPIGSTHEGSIRVARTQVPLPAGRWTVTGLNESRNNHNNVLATLTLANIVNGKLMAYIGIVTNVDLSRGGWQPHKFCSRKDVYFIQKDADYPHEQACWGVSHAIKDATSTYKPAYGKNIQQALADRGMAMPRAFAGSLFRLANEHSFITYEILINAEYYGFSSAGESTWASSPWHKELVAQDPKRQQFLEQVKAQHAPFYSALKAQFR